MTFVWSALGFLRTYWKQVLIALGFFLLAQLVTHYFSYSRQSSTGLSHSEKEIREYCWANYFLFPL
jgi:hypothetical protein